MKTLLAIALMAIAINTQASVFFCSSYNTGSIVLANVEAKTVTLKDRFGNELDVLDGVDTAVNILNTEPVTTQTVFIRNAVKVFTTEEQDGFIKGISESDDSFLCFKRN